MSLYVLARLFHLGAMSVWMGAGLLAPRDVKAVLLQKPLASVDIDRLAERLRRTARLMNASAYLTVGTGALLIALIALRGPGLLAIRPQIWAGLVLTLFAIGLGRYLIRPALVGIGELRQRLLDGEEISERDAAELAKRFAIGVHGESVVRVIVLILMVY